MQEVRESDGQDDGDDEDEPIPARALKVARALHSIAATTPRDVARALLRQEQDVHLARARIQSMRRLLDEAEQALLEDE